MNQREITLALKSSAHKRSFKVYLLALSAPIYLYHSLAAKDYWTVLFISCLALYAPVLWTAVALFLCYKIRSQFYEDKVMEKENILNVIVQSLQMNRLDEFSKAIEDNPELLYCDYQRRSLVAWCRYYKNTKAQELVIQLMKKYPREALAA